VIVRDALVSDRRVIRADSGAQETAELLPHPQADGQQQV
jgi:hypothetical protein